MGIPRPKCEWGGVGGCERPATHVVGFLHSQRFRLSCKDHLPEWGRHGRGYWVSRLEGFMGGWGEARQADALRTVDEFHFDKARKLVASLAGEPEQ